MNTELAEALKKNWYLGAAGVACVAAGVVMGMRGGNTPVTEAQTLDGNVAVSANPTATDSSASTPWKNLQTKNQHVKSSIAEYRHKIHELPPTEDTDMDIMRMANLCYSKLQDYDEAATYYEKLLSEYPDFEMKSIVFQNLGECYKRLGEHDNERQTYRRMMRHFPEGTNENDFARHQLGL